MGFEFGLNFFVPAKQILFIFWSWMFNEGSEIYLADSFFNMSGFESPRGKLGNTPR
jgi:hypothetical protein